MYAALLKSAAPHHGNKILVHCLKTKTRMHTALQRGNGYLGRLSRTRAKLGYSTTMQFTTAAKDVL